MLVYFIGLTVWEALSHTPINESFNVLVICGTISVNGLVGEG